jgi:hypothetical protein
MTSNMIGITLLYNARTGNTATSQEQLVNLDRLFEISHLENDWDGNGAGKISCEAIEVAFSIIKNVSIQPVIYPTARKSIQLQYELEDRSYLEFEIFEKNIMCMKVPKRIYADASFEEIDSGNINRVNQIVKEFYG